MEEKQAEPAAPSSPCASVHGDEVRDGVMETGTTTPFNTFMARYIVQQKQKGQNLSHNSIGTGRGQAGNRYLVPMEDEVEFFQAYKAALAAGEPLHLAERPTENSPVVLDFDFRFEPSPEEAVGAEPRRRYTLEHVQSLLQAFFIIVAQVLELLPVTRVYILEKPGPRTEEVGSGERKKLIVKDGLHVVIPSVVTCNAAKKLMRERALPTLAAVFNAIGTTNKADDVFDEAAIDNNWQMYGSTKPGQPPYSVTRVYEWRRNVAGGTLAGATDGPEPDPVLVELLSVRNKTTSTPFADEAVRAEVERRQALARRQHHPPNQCPPEFLERQARVRAEKAAKRAAKEAQMALQAAGQQEGEQDQQSAVR